MITGISECEKDDITATVVFVCVELNRQVLQRLCVSVSLAADIVQVYSSLGSSLPIPPLHILVRNYCMGKSFPYCSICFQISISGAPGRCVFCIASCDGNGRT